VQKLFTGGPPESACGSVTFVYVVAEKKGRTRVPIRRKGSTESNPEVFFAYSADQPLVAETMRNAAERIARRSRVPTITWEVLSVEGQLVVPEVLRTIDQVKVVVAEVGSLNSNVLFEVGYALSRGKYVMLCIDETDNDATRNWRELGVLGGVGYTGYGGSSEEFAVKFETLRPDLKKSRLWEDLLVTGGVSPREPRSLFYMESGLRGDAERSLDRVLLRRSNLSVIDVSSDESGLAPLSWYSVRVYRSSAALVHLRGPARTRAKIHNARASLLAGMAAGLDLPLLMVADDSYIVPFDYRDMLLSYHTARQLTEVTDAWLNALPTPGAAGNGRTTGRRELAAELPVRRFGEYVAENEQDELAEYFVQTGEYDSVLASQSAVFVGRKGTGKTANMLRASEELGADRRNLVVVIKPSGYELESMLEVLSRLPRRDLAEYLLDSLWRYLLYTEIAYAAKREAENRPAGIASGSPMDALRAYLDSEAFPSSPDFAVRLEGVIASMVDDITTLPTGVADFQAWVTSKLHSRQVLELRDLTGHALKDKSRVAIFIDNLDKAWERDADRELQSRLILGLLTAVGKVERELRKGTSWNESITASLAVFLRADIFDVVRQHAREPDKITTLEVKWNDPELLARIIEDRYVAQRGEGTQPASLWADLFCPSVRGKDTRSYLLTRSLPRPRDLVYLCNSAILTATNRRHQRIEPEDIESAELQYSSFAFDALLVEGSTNEELDNVLFEFAGSAPLITQDEALALISRAAVTTTREEIFSKLLRANFLGLEVADNIFEYISDDRSERRASVLSRRLTGVRGAPSRVTVHPAFRPYLGIAD
jgi:hypothetical protein